MPLIPDPNQMGRQLPGGPQGIIRADTGQVARAKQSAAAIEGQTAASITSDVTRGIDRVSQLAYNERQRLNQLKITEAENSMLGLETEMTVGADGYKHVKQGDVLKPEFMKKYSGNFESSVKAISDNLATDEQRELFKQVADKRRSSFMRGVMNHAISESDAYEETVFNDQLASHANYAMSQPTNPDAVIAGVEGTRAAVLNRLAQKGINDPTAVEAAVQKAVGGVHAGVIDAARRAGNISYANDYLAAKKGEMSADQVAAVESKLKPATDFMVGDQVGNDAFALKQSGKSNTEVQKFINEKTKGNPDARRAAQASMLELEQAEAKDLADKAGAVGEIFTRAGATPEAYNAAINSEEFLSLPPEERRKNMDYMYSRMMSGERAADAEASRRERELANSIEAREIMSEYASNPDTLARMSPREITALMPSIGRANVDRMLSWQNSIKSEASKAKIDTDLRAQVMAQVGKNKEKQAKANQIIDAALMDWRVENPGSLPTYEEQKALAAKALDEYIEVGVLWDSKQKAYEAKPGEGYPAAFAAEFPGVDEKVLINSYQQFQAVRAMARKLAQQDGATIPTDAEIMVEYKAALKARGQLK